VVLFCLFFGFREGENQQNQKKRGHQRKREQEKAGTKRHIGKKRKKKIPKQNHKTEKVKKWGFYKNTIAEINEFGEQGGPQTSEK